MLLIYFNSDKAEVKFLWNVYTQQNHKVVHYAAATTNGLYIQASYSVSQSYLKLQSSSTYIKLYFEFILDQFMDIPALAKPPCSFFVGFQTKPVVVRFFIVLYILKQEHR